MLLTIAIPTYNRVHELKETIKYLLPQVVEVNKKYNDCVDILICDNASEDDTKNYIIKLKNEYSVINYYRANQNGGIDRNIHNCSVQSSSTYVFSLSDDDITEPGLIAALVDYLLKSEAENIKPFIFLNAYVFSGKYETNQSRKMRIFNKDIGISEYISKDEFISKIGIWSTFVSSFVYHRKSWINAEKNEQFIGTDIYLTYVLFAMLRNSEKMTIFNYPYIAIRAQYSGNYRILKAFCMEWSRLINHVAINEWGYDKAQMRVLFRKTFYENLLNKMIDVKICNPKIPVDDYNNALKALDGYYIERVLAVIFLNANIKFIKAFKKVITLLGIKTDNFNLDC